MPPPFLQYQNIINALVRVPGSMLAKKRFGEMKMALKFGSSTIATGHMTKSRLSELGLNEENIIFP